MNISNRLAIGIIIISAFCAHLPTLFDGFVGDDNMLIVNNTAYRSWDNFNRLLFHDYIIDIDDILNGGTRFLGSSDVSYRPVKSATHFVDYWMWGLNPFGYHLNNLLLHGAIVVLLYYFLLSIFRNPSTALLACVLFAVHPIQSETVSSINYRHNLLIGFFCLAAMLSYMASYRKFKVINIILSYVFYFLAVFSKEAAVIFPLIVIAYDVFIKNKSISEIFKGLYGRYIGYFLVIAVFLYTYFKIFPNVVSEKVGLFGGTWTTHIIYLLHIFIFYLQSFIAPWFIKSLPPLYNVSVSSLFGIKTIFAAGIFVLTIWFYLVLFRTNRKICFLLFWFLASYVIVSNIIPFVNPISYRFMYLPSIGLIAVIAFYIDKFLRSFLKKMQSEQLGLLIKIVVVIVLMSWTWPLDAAWRSDYTMTLKMYRDFPHDPRANMYAGMTYFHMGDFEEAKLRFDYAMELGLDDPRIYHYLATIHINQPEISEPLLIKCVNGFPQYASCHSALARIYILEGLTNQARNQSEITRQIKPNYATYGYLIQIYLLENNLSKAKKVLKDAKSQLSDPQQIESLNKLFSENPSKFPIDLGF